MRSLFIALFALAPALAFGAGKLETRCGWLQNPTPANWWLVDADGTWILSVQGGYQARGLENLPEFNPHEYVETNGSYGYGCACLRVIVNKNTEHVVYVASGRALRLKRCLADKNLPRP